jgi:hypothetical protein
MTNRIRHIRVSRQLLSPVDAELLVSVGTDDPAADMEIYGRFVGPTCPYSTTIEVAYPLTMLPGKIDHHWLQGRVVIPEPSWWDPVSPFLYHGRIELRRAGVMLDSAKLRYGLRVAQLNSEGLFWNGKRLLLRAAVRENLDEPDMLQLRRQGINALVVSSKPAGLVERAERLGFLLLVRVAEPTESFATNSPAVLAWLLPIDWKQHQDDWLPWMATFSGANCFFGVDDPEAGIGIQIQTGSSTSAGMARLHPGVDSELGRIV